MNEKQQGGAKTKVCYPHCGRTLGDVLESLVRQRGKFKAQREEARREIERLRTEVERTRAATLREVVEVLEGGYHPQAPCSMHPADYITKRFELDGHEGLVYA